MTAKMEDRQVKFEVKNTKDKKYGSFYLLQFPITFWYLEERNPGRVLKQFQIVIFVFNYPGNTKIMSHNFLRSLAMLF